MKKLIDIVFWIVIIAVLVIWTTDFIMLKVGKNPIFCLKNIDHIYEDGITKECVGFGYKTFQYERTSINKKTQFGLFFIEMEK